MENYKTILDALKRSQMSKTALVRCTGMPYGLIDRALQVLTIEGKVVRYGARYQLKEQKVGKGLSAT